MTREDLLRSVLGNYLLISYHAEVLPVPGRPILQMTSSQVEMSGPILRLYPTVRHHLKH
jgi:hypothetical protein